MTQPASGFRNPRDSRPRFTGRAAILAVVLCAVALSLAYPVREYIAQRRQIDALRMQQREIASQVKNLQAEHQRLTKPAYIERVARDELHMCLPTQMCYVIVGAPSQHAGAGSRQVSVTPWYERLWSSVQQANATQPAQPAAVRGKRAVTGQVRGPSG